MSSLKPRIIKEFYIFLASPGDMDEERQEVQRFFEDYNRHTASRWGVRFNIVDWENYSTAGIGRPQELITQQTIEQYRDSLALVIGLMGQRFGSPTGTHESGTEEEFRWALKSYRKNKFPEVKWFFRRIDQFTAPSDLKQIKEALQQWEKVLAFRRTLEKGAPPVYYKQFSNLTEFKEVLKNDLSMWLSDSMRPWITARAQTINELHDRLNFLQVRSGATFHNSLVLGTAFIYNEQFDQAVIHLKRAKQVRPDHAEPYKSLAAIYKIQRAHTESIQNLEELLQRHPQDYEAWNYLGWSYFLLGEYKKAREAYERALKIRNDYTDALFNLALLEQQQGNNTKYQELLERSQNILQQEVEKIRILLLHIFILQRYVPTKRIGTKH